MTAEIKGKGNVNGSAVWMKRRSAQRERAHLRN